MHNASTPAPDNLPIVTGYLADNWGHLEVHGKAPALVLNPAAAPLDLLAWCWAEIASLTAVSYGLDPTSADPMRELVQYRLPAVRDVLENAIERLIAGGKP